MSVAANPKRTTHPRGYRGNRNTFDFRVVRSFFDIQLSLTTTLLATFACLGYEIPAAQPVGRPQSPRTSVRGVG